MTSTFSSVFTPLQVVKKRTSLFIFVGTVVALFLTWALSPQSLLPKPSDVLSSFHDLWIDGVGAEFVTSYLLNLQAIGASILVSLALAYLSVLPVFNPFVRMSTGLRFLSMVGLSLAFQVAITNPHTVKVALLTFSISVWFIIGMLDVIAAIPQEQIDLARTLRMNPWQIMWEVVILGTADKAFDVLRQTSAMGWMMLTMVEGIVFSEGGIGTVLQTMQKHMRLADIMAIQIGIMLLGLAQDYFIGVIKGMFCPYAVEGK